jgi:hypothetical protein
MVATLLWYLGDMLGEPRGGDGRRGGNGGGIECTPTLLLGRGEDLGDIIGLRLFCGPNKGY